MPTGPDPDSPFLPSRVQSAFGVREPGTPTIAGQPNVQAGDVSYPAPPAVNTAIPGRPPETRTPTPSPGLGAQPSARTGAASTPTSTGVAATPIPVLPHQPTPAELPLGVSVSTPLGVASRGANNEPQLQLSPEGKARYQDAVMKTRRTLGPVPRIFAHPDLPQLDIQPGKWNYSPFTGSWSK